MTLFESSNGRTSPGNQLCFQGLSTLSHIRVPIHTHTPTHTHTQKHTSQPSLTHFFVSPSHSLEWQLLNCDKRAVSDQPSPYLGDWVNDLSITQPLLYSPSTDRVTHTAHLLRPVSPLLLFVATSYLPYIEMQICTNCICILLSSFYLNLYIYLISITKCVSIFLSGGANVESLCMVSVEDVMQGTDCG